MHCFAYLRFISHNRHRGPWFADSAVHMLTARSGLGGVTLSISSTISPTLRMLSVRPLSPISMPLANLGVSVVQILPSSLVRFTTVWDRTSRDSYSGPVRFKGITVDWTIENLTVGQIRTMVQDRTAAALNLSKGGSGACPSQLLR